MIYFIMVSLISVYYKGILCETIEVVVPPEKYVYLKGNKNIYLQSENQKSLDQNSYMLYGFECAFEYVIPFPP